MAGAITQDGPEITLPANQSFASYQFHVAEMLSTGLVDVAGVANDADANLLIGVIQNKPSAQYAEAVIRVKGVTKVIAGGTINEGAWVSTDASGHAIVATDFDNVIGIALTAGASNALMEVLLKIGCTGRPNG